MDFSKVIKINIPEGVAIKITDAGGNLLWKGGYTNLVPASVDTDGSIYNGVGYKENVRLSSTGGISGSAQNGSVTTGFIPWHGDGDVLRLKGVEWKNATANYQGHYYFNFYDGNKKFLCYLSSGEHASYGHIVTVTRDADGVETVVWNQSYSNTNVLLNYVRTASFVRINAYGKGKDMIVTINEEIE